MAFKLQERFGTDETFWTNIDKLHRILVCFSKDDMSEINMKTEDKKGRESTMYASQIYQNEFASKCYTDKEILSKKIEEILKQYLTKNKSDDIDGGSIQLPNRRLWKNTRELFYEDVNLFKKQSVLDDILDDISCLLKTPKVQLHVLTTSKGCIAGNLRYKEDDGSYIDCNETNQWNNSFTPCHHTGVALCELVEKDFQTSTLEKCFENYGTL
ncbi:meiotic recombination protein SPO11 [Nephila pilipes]|uniref:Meiotic recombination protein SPO11 n=1 Tax=Nephila pilipes TaxID=299642 RepID=A0A8X6UKF5_NEPPI|nr:meiotic recombination protein SPO11 [Nephila pilipes]